MAQRSASKAPQPCAARTHVSRRSLKALAAASTGKNEPLAAALGMSTEEGIFGFRPFAETWCGRLAMMGFVTSMAEEFWTGKGTLAQIHLMNGSGEPDMLVLALLCLVFGGATLAASANTLQKIAKKEMSPQDIARYANFLALNKESESRKAAAEMKARGDFATPGNDMAAIAASKAAGAPVDAFLSTNELAEGAAAAGQMKAEAAPAAAAPAPRLTPQEREAAWEAQYALDIEMKNGRWAMLGFLAAVLVEAATGQGIIGQGVTYLKWTGFLGPDSGF